MLRVLGGAGFRTRALYHQAELRLGFGAGTRESWDLLGLGPWLRVLGVGGTYKIGSRGRLMLARAFLVRCPALMEPKHVNAKSYGP